MHFRRARRPMNVGESRKENTSHDDTRVGGNTRPQLSSLLCNRSSDGRALHFALWIDDDTCVVLKVKEDAVRSPPWLALADNHGGHNLLPQLWLSLLDSCHDHVTGTASGQTVESRADSLDRDDVQIAGARVIAAVHDGSDRQTKGHLELVTGGRTSTTLGSHCD